MASRYEEVYCGGCECFFQKGQIPNGKCPNCLTEEALEWDAKKIEEIAEEYRFSSM